MKIEYNESEDELRIIFEDEMDVEFNETDRGNLIKGTTMEIVLKGTSKAVRENLDITFHSGLRLITSDLKKQFTPDGKKIER